MKGPLALLLIVLLAGCASSREPVAEPQAPAPPAQASIEPPAPPARGGYYKDDGPGENPPADLASIPDAVPKAEPLHRYANRPYSVFGVSYVPLPAGEPYRERGMASWYGKKFHGQRTSSGELYDMYAMSGAHKTLPIPSYARVTNLANGRSVVVRINDRGPFHSDRLIDLSYAAAFRLGYAAAGSALVEVEAVGPEEATVHAAAPPPEKPLAAAQAEPAQNAVYLQVGAFSSRENAEDLRSRLARELSWLTDSVQVLSIGNLWRLRVGPYGSSDAARAIAQRIEAELKLKPLVVR